MRNVNAVKYISYNYGNIRGVRYHLVRYMDGSGKLFTDEEMVAQKLARWDRR